MKVTMPDSLEAAVDQLQGIDALLTAKEWERAAIVATFVRLPGSGGPPDRGAKGASPVCTAQEFAALGIRGLAEAHAVRIYVKRWLGDGAREHPKPGAKVRLPDLPWEGTRQGSDGYDTPEGVATTVGRIDAREGGADQLAEAVATRPDLAKKVVERAVLSSGSVALHAEKAARERWEREAAGRELEDRPELAVPNVVPTGAELAALRGRQLVYRALQSLREAAEAVRGYGSSMRPEEAEYVVHLLDKLPATADLVRMSLQDGQPIDWDSVAASWGEGPGQ